MSHSFPGAKRCPRRVEPGDGIGLAGSCWGWPEPHAMFEVHVQRPELRKPNLYSGDGDVDLGTGATRSPNGSYAKTYSYDKHLSSTRRA